MVTQLALAGGHGGPSADGWVARHTVERHEEVGRAGDAETASVGLEVIHSSGGVAKAQGVGFLASRDDGALGGGVL